MMTDYMIDVLYGLGCVVQCFAALACLVALFLALNESSKSMPNKADLVFFVSVAFVSMITFVVIPSREIIRCFIVG